VERRGEREGGTNKTKLPFKSEKKGKKERNTKHKKRKFTYLFKPNFFSNAKEI